MVDSSAQRPRVDGDTKTTSVHDTWCCEEAFPACQMTTGTIKCIRSSFVSRFEKLMFLNNVNEQQAGSEQASLIDFPSFSRQRAIQRMREIEELAALHTSLTPTCIYTIRSRTRSGYDIVQTRGDEVPNGAVESVEIRLSARGYAAELTLGSTLMQRQIGSHTGRGSNHFRVCSPQRDWAVGFTEEVADKLFEVGKPWYDWASGWYGAIIYYLAFVATLFFAVSLNAGARRWIPAVVALVIAAPLSWIAIRSASWAFPSFELKDRRSKRAALRTAIWIGGGAAFEIALAIVSSVLTSYLG